MDDYAAFLERKQRVWTGQGLEAVDLPDKLFDWQAAITRWALRKGRAALFADCGLGKSFMQLAWADALPGRVLILAPLCVAEQTVAEGLKLDIPVVYARTTAEAGDAKLVITNYERLEAFDVSPFCGVVLDESSILKAFDGKTRTKLIQTFQRTTYRLCCTATPSPNDIAELANHAEFLGLMTRSEFLATWFVHDDAGWRMKKHAVIPFYRWLASWAIAMRRPSDLGYDDVGFELPALTIRDEVVESPGPLGGVLFPEMGLKGLAGRLSARRGSLEDRVATIVRLVLKSVDDERQKATVSESLAEPESRSRQTLSRRHEGAAERQATRVISTRRMEATESSATRDAMAQRASFGTETATIKAVWPHAGAIQAVNGNSASRVRDLRLERYEQADNLSARGPLPRDWSGQGIALHELQSRDRQISKRAHTASARGQIPKWVIWCGLNQEQDALAHLFGDLAVSVQGSDTYVEKVSAVQSWLRSDGPPVMISKVKVLGFGMNFQHCHHMAFVGLGDSYEQYYQAIRRCWRFGQRQPVDVRVVISDAECGVVENVRRKETEAAQMATRLLEHMTQFEREEILA